MRTDDISRQEAVNVIHKWGYRLTGLTKAILISELCELPSRCGNWLEGNGKLAEGLHDVYCSECGETSEYRGLYCPECGAFMINECRRRGDE